ncbi:hypothetical protein [Tychonema sp. LEGE 07203]|uniref:hypothetical protein n=1 Tax=Tychonema sp. LEGE 07203 TaxID=1828671 RepID=UPI00188084D3|nr:hypothetical protein [Tychonema sp. LEGE 07203]MBE9097520.1 hypothetical protein [Tychonema sp. LEGE 07203]
MGYLLHKQYRKVNFPKDGARRQQLYPRIPTENREIKTNPGPQILALEKYLTISLFAESSPSQHQSLESFALQALCCRLHIGKTDGKGIFITKVGCDIFCAPDASEKLYHKLSQSIITSNYMTYQK